LPPRARAYQRQARQESDENSLQNRSRDENFDFEGFIWCKENSDTIERANYRTDHQDDRDAHLLVVTKGLRLLPKASTSHDMDRENAALVTRKQVIDEIADD
jgi:hypothetical protein